MRDAMLIVHFIGIAMGVGTSLGLFFLGLASKKMEKEEGKKFRLNTFALVKMGHIGILLLFLSGGYLMTPYWKVLGESPLLITKLVLFLALAAFIGIIGSKAKKAKKGNEEGHLNSTTLLGRLALVTSLVIIVLAVLIFH